MKKPPVAAFGGQTAIHPKKALPRRGVQCPDGHSTSRHPVGASRETLRSEMRNTSYGTAAEGHGKGFLVAIIQYAQGPEKNFPSLAKPTNSALPFR